MAEAGGRCTWIAVALTDPRRSRWWVPAAGLVLGIGVPAKPLALAFAPVLAASALGLVVTYGAWWAYSALAGLNPVAIIARPGDHDLPPSSPG
jgi:hypothetical protein